MRKRESLLFRLLWSIAIPELLIFLIIGFISYNEVSNILNKNIDDQNESVITDILHLFEFMDASLEIIEGKIDNRVESISEVLRNEVFANTDHIETENLKKIRASVGMDTTDEDIYIIKNDGIIVNTTFEKDRNLQVFDFGDDFKNFLLNNVLKSDSFINESMTLESRTMRLKKYTYQSTRDRKYIIQFGLYSKDAGIINRTIREIFDKIKNERKDILALDIYVSPENPFSLISGAEVADCEERDLLISVFKNRNQMVIESGENFDTHSQVQYIYFGREYADLYKMMVLKIVKNMSYEKEALRNNLIRKFVVFALGILVLFSVLFFNARLITKPIKNIGEVASVIGSGKLEKRVPVTGNRELQELAMSFNKMTANLERSDKEIRQAHKEIQDSINYARRIQEAILPPTKLVKEYLKDSFILYLPKDVVAGDFYWFDTQGDDVYFAAADCTGHGVPGAMVSVVCANALTRVVGEMQITEPGEILDKVRELVVKNFEKSEQEVKDGMDISFCRLNLKTRELKYAGAHNPLYRITRLTDEATEKTIKNDQFMLVEYKGDRQPIGKHIKEKPFSQYDIQLLEGDTIFIFSDGYADQFGREDGRKFMYKPFKRLLLSIAEESPEKQRKILLNTFNDWKGSETQVDDVCVIGVRV